MQGNGKIMALKSGLLWSAHLLNFSCYEDLKDMVRSRGWTCWNCATCFDFLIHCPTANRGLFFPLMELFELSFLCINVERSPQSALIILCLSAKSHSAEDTLWQKTGVILCLTTNYRKPTDLQSILCIFKDMDCLKTGRVIKYQTIQV